MPRLIVGFLILYAALQAAAGALGSTRGELGILVALLVVGAGILVQYLLHNESWKQLGLTAPAGRGIWTALFLAAVSLVAGWVCALVANVSADAVPGAPWLLLGMLAQGGIAEELVFRGYLFGRIRRASPFWRAAAISAVPFALVHLTLFLSLPWPVALTALVMSVAMTFPLSWLYELGGQTIWAPALLHAVLQAVPKLITPDSATFAVVWMVAGMLVAWSAFAVRQEKDTDAAD